MNRASVVQAGHLGDHGAPRCWKALLAGRQATQARAIVNEIAMAIEAQPPSEQGGLQGCASSALLLAYCGRPTAAARLESALVVTTRSPVGVSLFSGISGMSWLAKHLVTGREADLIAENLDKAILRHIDVPHWNGRFDLIAGLVGIGASAAARCDGLAPVIAERVLSHLEALMTTSTTDGIDTGVAHGIPGVIGLLAQFVEAGVQPRRSLRLLRNLVRWLLRTIPPARPRFGTRCPEVAGDIKRIGWCYGDVGVGAMLLRASRVLGSFDLQREALALLRQAAILLGERGVHDTCFCHGIAGIAHIYNVAFQSTGDLQIRAEAERWLCELVRRWRRGTGIGGYTFLKAGNNGMYWSADATLLSGVVGVALVLLAAIEGRAPEWHSLLLL